MAWDHLCYPKKLGGMGFRKIREFNIAMLGKQAWKMMTDPDSLITKLMKARYFPSSFFQEAGFGSNPSYVWRSIIEAKDLVCSGRILKVGKGDSINIWRDPWIPDLDNPRISSTIMPGLEHANVSSLLKTDDREWDQDIIRDIFNENDANRILRIPLSYMESDDSWIWLEDDKGKYTVKSAYRLLSRAYVQPQSMLTGFNWLKLWSLSTPPKVKNFIWRALQNCLPTLKNLRGRHVNVIPTCPVCKTEDETLDHIFFHCPFTQRCWEIVQLHVQIADAFITGEGILSLFNNLNTKD